MPDLPDRKSEGILPHMDDARLVQMALSQGLVTKEQVAAAERELMSARDRGLDNSVWYLLQDLGYLSESQARTVRKGASSTSLGALEVDGYVIQGRLGQGGMGDVYRGRNASGHEVAIKLLGAKYQGNVEYLRRFEREARASVRLVHPHICHSRSSGTVQGTQYLVMDLVEGPSLKGLIQDKGPLPEREALVLLEQMAAALGYAWGHSVLHRDVKPANIIIGPARTGVDEPFCAKLIDFGLAKVWDEADPTQEDSAGGLTGAGLALGTPHYMSPEQASGQADLDQRCDIYGLGASLYHALMGHTMYTGKSSAVIMYKQVTETIDLTELRKKGARKQLVELLDRMLAKDRTKRIATWDEVLDACQRVKVLMHAGLGTAGAAGQSAAPSATPRVSAAIAAAVRSQTSAIATPLPPTTVESGQRGNRTPVLMAVAAAATLTAGICGWLLLADPTPTTTTPATLAARLATRGPTELLLAPGNYPPTRLGAAQSGLSLRAAGNGVIISALTIDAGANIALANINVQGPLVVAAGGRVTATGGSFGSLAIEGGRCDMGSATVTSTAKVSRQGIFSAHGGTFAAGFEGEDATISLNQTTITGELRATRSRLDCDGVRLTSAVSPAMALDRCPEVRLLRSSFTTTGTLGIHATGSQLLRCENVQITANLTALSWTGATAATWSWKGLTLQAPQAATGLPSALLAAAIMPVSPAQPDLPTTTLPPSGALVTGHQPNPSP